MPRILAINPGSTSTKVALFENEVEAKSAVLRHSPEELARYARIWDQLDSRLRSIRKLMAEWHVAPHDLDAVVGRGGLLKPVAGGVYRVNDRMLEDARRGVQGQHAANLGCALASLVAHEAGAPAFVVDPISVDEFEPLARYSGHRLLERRSLSHALNLHAAARRAAARIGRDYEQANFVVAHLGGGISVSPIRAGRIIDVNDASSDGPFSPERTGGLPLQGFITLCFSGKYSEAQIRRLVMGEGGLVSYLGTSSAEEVENRIAAGDRVAEEVYEAMAYQIAKEIGAMATVLAGKVDAVVITGGLARSQRLVEWTRRRVEFIAPVLVLAGEFEMRAMAEGALRALSGKAAVKDYS